MFPYSPDYIIIHFYNLTIIRRITEARVPFIGLIPQGLVVAPSYLLLYYSISLAQDCPQLNVRVSPEFIGFALCHCWHKGFFEKSPSDLRTTCEGRNVHNISLHRKNSYFISHTILLLNEVTYNFCTKFVQFVIVDFLITTSICCHIVQTISSS